MYWINNVLIQNPHYKYCMMENGLLQVDHGCVCNSVRERGRGGENVCRESYTKPEFVNL
jgi:hypothetical protein